MTGWGLGGWFGGGQANRRDAPKDAILQLRSTLEMLNKRERHLQNQMDDEDQKARKFVNTNKAGMYLLRGSMCAILSSFHIFTLFCVGFMFPSFWFLLPITSIL